MAADGVTEILRITEFIPPRPLARILKGATANTDPTGEAQAQYVIYRAEVDRRWEAQRRKIELTPLP
jgi:hypothetical protein